MKKEYITEAIWGKLLIFFKSIKGINVGDEKKLKNFITAIYWMIRTGAQWRELPTDYGKWNSIFKRFNAWAHKGIWVAFHKYFIEDPDLEYIMIDATVVRAHACAAGYGKQELEGLGRSAGGFTCKIHAKIDALGNPLEFIITPGNRHDITQAGKLLQNVTDSHVIGDRGYDSNVFRNTLISQNCTPVIPSKSNSLNPCEYDKHIYKERHIIECFFGKIKYFRRIFSRFDKSARNYLACLSFVGVFIWLR